MISSRFAYAFSAGLVAAINPCGFALLPTYLAYFLGIDNEETSQRIGSDLGRAIKVGAALTAGFLTVFAIMGVLWGTLARPATVVRRPVHSWSFLVTFTRGAAEGVAGCVASRAASGVANDRSRDVAKGWLTSPLAGAPDAGSSAPRRSA